MKLLMKALIIIFVIGLQGCAFTKDILKTIEDMSIDDIYWHR